MGADLIVFLSKGPSKCRKSDIKKAEKRAEEIIIFAGKILEILQKRNNREGPSLTTEEEKVLEDALRNPLLKGFNDQEQYSDIIECEGEMEEIAASTAKDEVAEFLSWWESPHGSDTASRPDPDDKKQQIVVCGDMTWGDAPEGLGYQTMRKAEWYGIPTLLGVK